MTFFRKNFDYAKQFYEYSIYYLKDSFVLHMIILLGIIPFLSMLIRIILNSGEIAYISYDNIGTLIYTHPIIFINLIACILLLLIFVFLETSFLIFSFSYIKQKKRVRSGTLIIQTLNQYKKINIPLILFLIAYFLLILPFGGLGYHSDLLTKLKIPGFILDFIFAYRVLFIVLIVLFYLFFLYLGLRLLFVLPFILLYDLTLKDAIKKSWSITGTFFWQLIGQLIFFYFFINLFFYSSLLMLIGIQKLIEYGLPHISLTSAIFILFIIRLILLLQKILAALIIFFIIFIYIEPKQTHTHKLEKYRHINPILSGILILLGSIFFISTLKNYAVESYEYLTDYSNHQPLTISHRGVDHNNAVQNTITALKTTSEQTHPDFIEMDIQKTKDHQFIVFHDFSLKSLAKQPHKIKEHTLEELRSYSISEHHQTDQISSFQEYLDAAELSHQKLLVELKIPKNDPETDTIIQEFINQYAQRLIDGGHELQTLNFYAATTIKEQCPELSVGYIMPFNVIGPPLANVDFFSVEYTTLTKNFIKTAHQEGKQVYAWTVNDAQAMTKMMIDGIDGIITDQMTLLNQVITQMQEQPVYSNLLLDFIIRFE